MSYLLLRSTNWAQEPFSRNRERIGNLDNVNIENEEIQRQANIVATDKKILCTQNHRFFFLNQLCHLIKLQVGLSFHHYFYLNEIDYERNKNLIERKRNM